MSPKNGRIWCATLGCDKNLVDSEALLGRFLARGYEAVAEPEDAAIWVLNTCGFIAAARSDSEDTLDELIAAKGDRLLVVTGCYAQEHGDQIRRAHPEVDLVGGVGRFDELIAALEEREPALPAIDPVHARYVGLADRPLLTPSHVAFVKIGEGCNCACTFCRIPIIRGKLRSRPVAEIEAEVRGLVERGVTEIQVVSQNTSDFGRDTGETLLELVRRLDAVSGLRRIRLLYLYAGLLSAENALRLLDLERVVPYLDLPIQHASPRILRAMKRPGDPDVAARFFATIRRERPDTVLRSTALLGFPGEAEEDVEQLLDFLARVEFDHLGTYRYSPEAGTAAAAMAGVVADEVVADREARVVDLQAEIAGRRQEARLGGVFDVVVDAVVPAGDPEAGAAEVLRQLPEATWLDERERETVKRVLGGNQPVALGRSHHFGYDLDGIVAIPGSGLAPGDWLAADFRAVTPYDVWAVPAGMDRNERDPS